MHSHITRYDKMPIPPIKEQTEYVEAGAVTIGVEFRLVNADVSKASNLETAGGEDTGNREAEDRGVALHVFGKERGELVEYLRFDCFDEDPHYHYVSWKNKSNEMLHLDPIAEGDALEWALGCIQSRLPQMLARAGAADLAKRVDPVAIAAALPRVTDAAYRARFHSDAGRILQGALKR